jgi:acetyl-CoA carboxylase biotin carboxyl carrier protein
VVFDHGDVRALKIEELKELLELVSERNIAELELESEGVKLKIRKALGKPEAERVDVAAPAARPVSAGVVTETPAPAPEAASENGLLYVSSPMVGTFYRQAQPGSDPFAREGDYVRKGQVLCIIEAMKLMNEIESEHEGQLVKVLVENGRPVQYGDHLFAIRSA